MINNSTNIVGKEEQFRNKMKEYICGMGPKLRGKKKIAKDIGDPISAFNEESIYFAQTTKI